MNTYISEGDNIECVIATVDGMHEVIIATVSCKHLDIILPRFLSKTGINQKENQLQ